MAQVRLTVTRVSRAHKRKEIQNAGEVVTVSDAEARRMIEAGQAVNVISKADEEKPKRRTRKKSE